MLLLRFAQRQEWWLASLFLLFITIKPHTLYLVTLAFLFWTISERRWTLLLGSGLGILLATGLALLFNPQVLHQYFYAVSHHPPDNWATPTLGGALRYLWGIDQVWLQFFPSVLGVIWFCFYWYKKRLNWQWPEQLPLLVAVSVLTAAYGWTCDYVVLLLPILSVLAGLLQQARVGAVLVGLALYLVIDGANLAANLTGYIANDFWYMWLAPALVGWYFLMRRPGPARQPS